MRFSTALPFLAIVALVAFTISNGVAADADVASYSSQFAASDPSPYPKEILKNMNLSVDPCEHFYEYACGQWIARTVLPPSEPIKEKAITDIQEGNTEVLKDIITGGHHYPKITPYFKQCMDMEQRNKNGFTGLQDAFDRLNNVPDMASFMHEVGTLQAMQIPALVSFGITADAKHPTKNLAELDQGGFALPDRSYYGVSSSSSSSSSLSSTTTPPNAYFSDVQGVRKAAAASDDDAADVSKSVIPQYIAHISKMFQLAGVDGATAKTKARYAVDVETSLARAALPGDAIRDPHETYNPMTIKELQTLTPNVPWGPFLRGMAFEQITSFNIAEPKFLQSVDQSVASKGYDPDRASAYLQWQLIHGYSSYLSQSFVNETFSFFGTVLSGESVQGSLESRCISTVSSTFGDILAKHYVERKFTADAFKVVSKQVDAIEHAFGANLKTLKWMDPVTRKAALKKLSEVTKRVGYPQQFRDYQHYQIVDNDFFLTTLFAAEREFQRATKAYFKPVDRSAWEMEAFIVNAYYEPTSNSINFPAGILQFPYFSAKQDPALNFGGSGLIMGHELSHGFDDQGSQYNGQGKLQNWWAPKTLKKFHERTQCLANQYSQFQVLPGVHVNGNLTLGENIADNGGMKTTTAAYTHLVGKAKANYKLLWVGYAQTWCAKAQPKFEKLRVKTDVHSPPKFRVLGPLMNLEAFSEEFQCKVGSQMHPEKRCEVW